MLRQSTKLTFSDPVQTCRFAQAMAEIAEPGDVFLLSGPVGTGKTHFARCLIQAAMPSPEDVPSPTYTLVQTYAGKKSEIWHADLYRLTDPSEIEELGLSEAFSSAICLVEWPERLGSVQPVDALALDFSAPGDVNLRELTLSWNTPAWAVKLADIL